MKLLLIFVLLFALTSAYYSRNDYRDYDAPCVPSKQNVLMPRGCPIQCQEEVILKCTCPWDTYFYKQKK